MLYTKFYTSSKSEKMLQVHADYVDMDVTFPLMKALKDLGKSADIMIEAKAKDLACLRFEEELGKLRGFKRISGGIIKI